jgi:hypothetical protein
VDFGGSTPSLSGTVKDVDVLNWVVQVGPVRAPVGLRPSPPVPVVSSGRILPMAASHLPWIEVVCQSLEVSV